MKKFDNPFAPGIWRRLPIYLTFLMTLVQFGVEGSLSGAIQASDQWQSFFDYPTGSMLGILSGIQYLGTTCGNLVAPYASDYLGRRRALLLGACGTILFVALQTSAQNLDWYLASRFFLGFFLLFCHNASPAFIAEFAPTQERSIILGCYSPMYFIGGIVISWTCYSTVNWPNSWSWRAPSLVQAVPAILQVIMYFVVPESPRWLALHGKPDEALKVLIKYHGQGQETEAVRQTFLDITENSGKQVEDNQGSWKDLFANKSITIRTVIAMVVGIASQWSGNGLISYYFVLILDSVGITDGKDQTLFNGMLNVWSLLFCIAIAFLSQRVSIRRLIVGGIAAMLTVWTLFTILSARYAITPSDGLAGGVLFCIFAFNAAYGGTWSTLFMTPCQLVPSILRAKLLSAQNTIDYLGLFMNVYANPILMDILAWKYYIVYIVLLALQLVFFYFAMPESRGLSNEEIVDYFDGQLGEGTVGWTMGPRTRKLMLESQRMTRERRAEQLRREDALTDDKASDQDKLGAASTAVLPAV